MNLSDLNSLAAPVFAYPVAATATVTGPVINLQQIIGTLKVTQSVGAVSGTTPTLNGKIQDSADGVSFADVDGYTFATVTASTNSQSIQVDTRSVRQYVRYVGTIAGTTPSFALAVSAVALPKVH